jgi:hypothetical protein
VLVAAAVCPHPPLLVSELSAGAAHELDALRGACDEAVGRLLRADPTVVAVVGRASTAGPLTGLGGSFAGFGVPLSVGTGEAKLPLPHTMGAWLLDRAGWTGLRMHYGATDDEQPAVGDLHEPDRLALLVMGDASARRSERAPGYFDPRAEQYDASVAAALRTGPKALAVLDQRVATELLVAGWPAWQVLARAAAGRQWSCELSYDEAPYGVGYLVASWMPV